MFSRRCGALTLLVLSTLALLINAPFARSQALTIVHSSTRSAGSATPGFNGDTGSATTISLNNPTDIVFDSIGNQYISDTLNNCVRKIDTSGNIATIVGLAVDDQNDTCNTSLNPTPTPTQGLYKPTGLAVDSSNRLYIADSMHNCVRTLASGASGVANLTTVAGTCGSVPSASVTPSPSGLAVDATNNIYIALQDSSGAASVNQVVRHLSGNVATHVCLVAGAPSEHVATNCAGITNGISLTKPSGLALNFSGDLFIADTGNNCVRQVVGLASGPATQTTVVGQCINDGSGTSATALHNPFGIVISPTQSLYISETSPNNIVSNILGSNSFEIVGGLPNGIAGPYDPHEDGKAAISTPFNGPRGLAFDSVGRLFIADSLNNIFREVSTNLHFPNTPVGSPGLIQPITFVVNQPINVTSNIGTDYSITSSTCTGSLAPAAFGATPNTCQVFVRLNPTRPGLRRSALKLTDSISGTSVFVGLQAVGTGALSLIGTGTPITIASGLASPASITTDSAGNVYVLENAVGLRTSDIRRIPVAGGAPSSIVASCLDTPSAIASDAAGNWFVADAIHGTVSRFGADGSINASYITGLDTPTALYIDIFNNLYIAQTGSTHNVIEVYTSGARRIVAGSGSNTAADGVPSINASFVSPSAIAKALNGTLYIADQGGHHVYAIDGADTIRIAAGNGTTNTSVGGEAIGTAIIAPSSLAIDAAGDLYIADQSSGTIYTVYASSASSSDIAAVFETSTPSTPNGRLSIALDASGNLFISKAASDSVIELNYSNPALNFGTIMVGSSSNVKIQGITNAGTDNLNITSPFSTVDSHFAMESGSTSCGASIFPGSRCTLGLTFTPTMDANYSTSALVSLNSYNGPQSIALTGTGKQAISLTVLLTAQAETYGRPFIETVNFGNISTTPTGTITYTTGGQTLCTLTGTFSASTICNAPESGLSAGNYTVTFTYSGDSNYNPASGIVSLTVNPAPLTESVLNAVRPFGTSNPIFHGILIGAAGTDTILVAYSTTATTASPVGSYPITATLTAVGSASLSNYAVANAPGTLTITQGTPAYNLPAQTEVYGQPFFASLSIAGFSTAIPPTGRITFSFAGKPLCSLNGTFASANICNAPPSGLATGTYTISFGYSGDSNYAPYSAVTTLVVTPAPLTVTIADVDRPYGSANPSFSASVSGAAAGDTFTDTFSTSATINSPVGIYPINDVLSGAAISNYSVTIIPATLTISKAAVFLNVAVSSAARTYGAANPAFASIVTGVVNSDTLTIDYSTSATAVSPVGTYPIVAKVSGAALSNYNLTASNGTLTVLPANLTVSPSNASRPYGAANPALTGTTAGLVNGDTIIVTYLTTANLSSPVGTYAVVASPSGAALSNYNVSTVNANLTVTTNPNSLVIDVHNAARVYGTANPILSGTVTGVVPGDDVVITYTTNANAASSAGSYPISARLSGTSAGNYIATIHPGTLAINPASTLTSVATSTPSAAVGSDVTFTANVSANSGTVSGVVSFFDGTVLLGSTNLSASGAASFSTSALGIGSHTISAAYQAITNFTTSGASVVQIITRGDGAFNISANPATPYIKGSGVATYQITVTPTGAFTGQVALSCDGLPAGATCSFATPVVSLTSGGSVTTSMTVTTTPATAKLLAPAGTTNMYPLAFAAIFPAEFASLGLFVTGLRRRKTLGTQKARLLLLIFLTLGAIGLAGCSYPSTTPSQTYTVSITGTSLNFPAPSQATSVFLFIGVE